MPSKIHKKIHRGLKWRRELWERLPSTERRGRKRPGSLNRKRSFKGGRYSGKE